MYSSLASFLDFYPVLVLIIAFASRTPIIRVAGTAREPAQNELTVFGTWGADSIIFADGGELVSLHIEQFRLARLQSE